MIRVKKFKKTCDVKIDQPASLPAPGGVVKIAKNLVGDFTVVGKGGDTVFLLVPNTEAANDWAEEHLPQDAQRLGRGIAVEHRYIFPILEGILRDGLTLTERL